MLTWAGIGADEGDAQVTGVLCSAGAVDQTRVIVAQPTKEDHRLKVRRVLLLGYRHFLSRRRRQEHRELHASVACGGVVVDGLDEAVVAFGARHLCDLVRYHLKPACPLHPYLTPRISTSLPL